MVPNNRSAEKGDRVGLLYLVQYLGDRLGERLRCPRADAAQDALDFGDR